jgi:regulator of nonsense transcripts 1
MDQHDACMYCGVSEESAVVKCDGCSKWFCNGDANTAGSHIINHLVRSRHKAVALHESSPLGDAVLECYNCGGRNVFLLGFIPAKQDSIVVLLCREPCLSSQSIGSLKDDPNWDLSLWQPLIEERAFVPWLVKTPDTSECSNFNPLSNREIGKLEELWRQNPAASLTDAVEEVAQDAQLEYVPDEFSNAAHYQRVFAPLLKLEGEQDQLMKVAQSSQNVSVRWELSVSKKRVAYFMFTHEEHETKLMAGDELKISIPNFHPESQSVLLTSTAGTVTWEAVGYVVRVLPSEEVCLELRAVYSNTPGPWTHSRGFQVSVVWKAVSYDRMHHAMKLFATDNTSVSSVVYHTLLGKDIDLGAQLKVDMPKKWDAPNLPKLNHSQVYAIRKAISMPVCIIQGPAGTGKTVTTAALIYHMAQSSRSQILVCAPSNIACDHLTEKIHATGLKVVRVSAKSREEIMVGSSIEFLTLHAQVRQLAASQDQREFSKLLTLKDSLGELSRADERRYITIRDRIERRILDAADVICCTCAAAGDPRISRLRFKHVLVDEATQATEPECLIPLVLGAKQVILVGDHCQLGPVVLSKTAARAGLNRSMFERLMALGLRPIRLEVQYRMHPALSEFPSQTFYEGALQNGVTLAERQMDALKSFPWPNPELPMFFYHSAGTEEMSGSGTSFLNRAEALNIERLVTQFMKCGIPGKQIGVVTPYEGQRAHIQSVLQRHTTLHADNYRDIEVASVDAFQGREKDLIVLSCVRSNAHSGLGFLHDPRRLNVALTRARYGLVICGNAIAIARAPTKTGLSVWSGLISHLQKRSAIVEGPLGNFREVQFSIPSRATESAPVIPVETNSALENSFRAPNHYFEARRTSSRRRTHSVDSNASDASYVSQKPPAGFTG